MLQGIAKVKQLIKLPSSTIIIAIKTNLLDKVHFNKTFWIVMLLESFNTFMQLKMLVLPANNVGVCVSFIVNAHPVPLNLWIRHPTCVTSKEATHNATEQNAIKVICNAAVCGYLLTSALLWSEHTDSTWEM